MAYKFVPLKEYKEAAKIARNFIDELQRNLREHFTIDKSLIGSVKSRLVTRNGDMEPFDFDYQFEIKRIFDENLKAKDILNCVLKNINYIKDKHGFEIVENSSRVFRVKYKKNNNSSIWFNIEIALIKYENDIPNIIFFDKDNNKVIYNQEKIDYANDKELRTKFSKIRSDTKKWLLFKEKYLEKKNDFKKYKNRKSISIYKETVNEF